jgi:hypothetical protein
MFWFSAMTFLAPFAYTLLRISRRDAANESQTGDFSDALTSARTLSQVYEGEMEAEYDEQDRDALSTARPALLNRPGWSGRFSPNRFAAPAPPLP